MQALPVPGEVCNRHEGALRTMDKQRFAVDVAVLGAGIIGSCCAYNLARSGLKVALIDPARPTAGSSGACDGFLSVSTKAPGITMDLAVASRALYPDLAAALGGEVEFERQDSMLVVEDAADLPKIAAHVDTVRATGSDIAMIDPRAMRVHEPTLNPDMAGAALTRGDFKVSPYRMTFALARAALEHGAVALWNDKPVAFDVAGGSVRSVETARAIVAAEQFIFAAGVWSAELGSMVGLDIPVVPRRGELVVTDRLASPPRHILVSAKYLTAKADPEAAKTSPDPLVRLGHGFVLETTATGQCVIGSTRTFSGFDRTSSAEGVGAIVSEAIRRVPSLARAQMLRSFAGLRPFVPDKKPIIGRSGRLSNVLVATGHEGDGITLAPITGALIAGLVRGRAPSLDIAALTPDRFAKAA